MSFKLPPQSLVDQYTIIRHIDEGGMGTIYEAYDKSLSRKVALKFMSNELLEDPNMKLRFETEAKAIARVQHINVVSIYSIGEFNEIPYIAMEYVEGVSFHDFIFNRSLKFTEAYPYMIQMLEGVKALHDNGIIHRDLKPKNMICKKDGTLKIVDFGIAKLESRESMHVTAAGVVMGSGYYIAPEVVSGQPANAQADIRSLGVIFYETLMGRKPFKSTEYLPLLEEIAVTDIVFPKWSQNTIPKPVKKIILKMCERSLSRRYVKVKHVLQDLKSMVSMLSTPLNSTAVISHPKDISKELNSYRKQQSKSFYKQMAMALVGVVVIVSSGYGVYKWKSQEEAVVEAVQSEEPHLESADGTSNQELVPVEESSNPSPAVVDSPSPPPQKTILEELREDLKPIEDKSRVTSSGSSSGTNWIPPQITALNQRFIVPIPGQRSVSSINPQQEPVLTWVTHHKFNYYQIEIAQDKNFVKKVVSRKVTQTKYKWSLAQVGVFYWRVKGVYRGVASDFGQVGQFKIYTESPQWIGSKVFNHTVYSRNQLGPSKVPVKIQWTRNPLAAQYRVSLNGKGRSTASVNQQLLSARPQAQFQLAQEGPYEVQVAAVDKKGELVSYPPLIETVTVQKEWRLRAPVMSSNLNGSTQKLRGGGVSLQVQWKPVKGATTYEIQFSQDPRFQTLLLQRKLGVSQFQFKYSVPPGGLYWRVKAEGHQVDSEWSKSQMVQIIGKK